MSRAKRDIGNYSVSTRFGKGKKIYHDLPIARPSSRGDAIRQIEETYRLADWKETEARANSLDVGLEPKPLTDYTNEELKIILDNAESHRMIIYEK
jgi:hypothetical protein